MFKTIRSKALGVLGTSCIGAALLVSVSTTAQAATTTATFKVTANVTSSCSVTATDLAFGTYNVNSTSPTNGTSTISVNCTKGTAFTVAIDAGSNAGGAANFSSRQMSDGSATPNYLGYQLYSNSGHTTIWGDGTNSSSTVSGTGAGPGAGNVVKETVYGQIAAQQNVPAGSYTDSTVTVTVSY